MTVEPWIACQIEEDPSGSPQRDREPFLSCFILRTEDFQSAWNMIERDSDHKGLLQAIIRKRTIDIKDGEPVP